MEKNLRKRLRPGALILLALLLLSLTSYAQTIKITGKVTSADDSRPMPGVTVKVKDSPTGTLSGADGNYSINAKPGDVLVFSFISYNPQQIYIGSSTVINVALKPSTNDLSEVVVIG